MAWSPLKTKKDYSSALKRLDVLMDARRSDAQENEFLLLSYLVEEYEEQNLSIPDASPNEVLHFMMEMKGLKQKDLLPVLDSKSFVSKIINGSAAIPVDSMDALSRLLGIPVEALIPKSNLSARELNLVADPGAKYNRKK